MKAALRKKIDFKLRGHKPADQKRKSLKILKKLFEIEGFRKSKNVCFYVSMPGEVDTKPIIDRALKLGKKVFVPRCDRKKTELNFYEIKKRSELKKGFFGIMEPRVTGKKPVHPKKIDCVIVPGVAFDKELNRLGRGKGYYDKFLSRLPKKTKKIGIGFSFQLVGEVPIEDHDQKLDIILTD